jgi:hypothetical protein
MSFTLITVAEAVALFTGMLLFLEAGRRIGRRLAVGETEGNGPGSGAVEGAIFALFGLLIAFTFSGAAERFEERKHLVVRESDEISTAWLRLDLMPEPSRSTLRDLFRKYVDSRIETYRRLPDVAAAEQELAHSEQLQEQIWAQAVVGTSRKNDTATTQLVLTSLNSMFDITTQRTWATRMHPPQVIFVMLFVLALGCAFLAGMGMSRAKSPLWIHMIGFAALCSFAVWVIIEIEYPRLGVVRVDNTDRVLVEERDAMK